MFKPSPKSCRTLAASIVLTIPLLNGCTQPPPPVSNARLYAIDQQGGAATCTVSKVVLADGKEADATLSVANDGGWCAFTVAADNKPYAAGLLTVEPTHGRVYVHSVGDTTRIDYTPDAGFTGSDGYTVRLLPGAPSLKVAVTVTAGPASVVAPPPPPASKPAPTRRQRS